MEFDKKALHKVLGIFFILIIIVILLIQIFGFPHFLFNTKVSYFIKKISILATLFISFVSSYFGFKLARKRNRNKKKWASICFIFSIWGLMYLYFLPILPSNDTCEGMEVGP